MELAAKKLAGGSQRGLDVLASVILTRTISAR
jgi:hypothetical protein